MEWAKTNDSIAVIYMATYVLNVKPAHVRPPACALSLYAI